MELHYYGPRGSLPTPGKETVRYGGNTTCLVIKAGSTRFIIDGGSGLRVLGNDLMRQEFGVGQGKAYFLWTHFHWDHINGFPFFVPNFITGNQFVHFGSEKTREVLERQQDFINFPVAFKQLTSQHTFHRVTPDEAFEIEGVLIENCETRHPAGGFIYKFSYMGKSFVFATDFEHPESGFHEPLLKLAYGADLLIYDAQYTPEEYQKGHLGWGHSTWEKGVELAHEAEVKHLHLYHHDQLHSDAFLENQILKPARHRFVKTELAREGWRFFV